jgi:hypothetical protein
MQNQTSNWRSPLALLAVFAYLLSFMALPAAQADMIGTRAALDADARADRVAEVQRLLSQDRVEEQMVALGVDSAAAKARVAGLNDAELTRLESELENLPAAGDALAVIGVVFLVLLILELVGAIDLFQRI